MPRACDSKNKFCQCVYEIFQTCFMVSKFCCITNQSYTSAFDLTCQWVSGSLAHTDGGHLYKLGDMGTLGKIREIWRPLGLMVGDTWTCTATKAEAAMCNNCHVQKGPAALSIHSVRNAKQCEDLDENTHLQSSPWIWAELQKGKFGNCAARPEV